MKKNKFWIWRGFLHQLKAMSFWVVYVNARLAILVIFRYQIWTNSWVLWMFYCSCTIKVYKRDAFFKRHFISWIITICFMFQKEKKNVYEIPTLPRWNKSILFQFFFVSFSHYIAKFKENVMCLSFLQFPLGPNELTPSKWVIIRKFYINFIYDSLHSLFICFFFVLRAAFFWC